MSRRALFTFLGLNVLVTFAVTTTIILIAGATRAPTPTPQRGLLQVVITATPDPNITPQVIVKVVTATPSSGIAILPTPGPGTPTVGAGADGLPTLDPAQLPPSLGTVEAPTLTPTDPSGCPTYTIKPGDILGNVAPQFGVTVADVMRANDLTERDITRLQIGQVLIMPVNGCGLATPTPEPTATATGEPTRPPTSTPLGIVPVSPTQLEVVRIINPGDITTEGLELRNASGTLIEIGGWTLRDSDGNTFTFPALQLFESRRVIVYTRAGENTALALFWGLTKPVWARADQEIIITDADGKEQVRYGISGPRTPNP